ncbi:MAG: hypothetical protein QOH70_4178 [Blastocatellia bacterium]|jgi:hypothetical protein|nr:hypothetical protein [Blastocatellia bacterium]
MRGNAEINVDLWPDGVWSQNELDGFRDLLSEFGSTSGQLSSDTRGIELQILIAFLAGALATGFFGKLGSDLYEQLRNGLKHLLLKRSGDKSEDDEPLGRLSFSYRDRVMGLYAFYTCRYSSEEQLDVLFTSMHPLDSLVMEACRGSLFPFTEGNAYDIHAILEFDQRPQWRIRIRRYTEEGNALVLNEFFEAELEASQLKESKWAELEWDYRPGLVD